MEGCKEPNDAEKAEKHGHGERKDGDQQGQHGIDDAESLTRCDLFVHDVGKQDGQGADTGQIGQRLDKGERRAAHAGAEEGKEIRTYRTANGSFHVIQFLGETIVFDFRLQS